MNDLDVVSPSLVTSLYRAVLGRDPESVRAVRAQIGIGSVEGVLKGLLTSPEYLSRQVVKRATHELFDVKSVLDRYAVRGRNGRPGHITNFLGVHTNVDYCGWTVEGAEPELPVPGNFHATSTEWGAVLRAVDLAGPVFTMIELGAGWGCWMVNTAVAAKRSGRSVLAIGVEGDQSHASWIKAHAETNGLADDEYRVDHSVAWGQNGFAVFPRSLDAAVSYGQEPRFFSTYFQADEFASSSSGAVEILRAKRLDAIADGLRRIDLLHIDIQGEEDGLVNSSLEFLDSNVAYVVIGTHGRQIEGSLISALGAHGWVLEIEEPCSLPMPLQLAGPAYVDGLQGWRNPRLVDGLKIC